MARNSNSTKMKGVCYDHSDSEKDAQQNLSQSLLKFNITPRRKLIILSIGRLLCHRICRKDKSNNFPIYRSPDAANGSYTVYKRPYCEAFMKFCLERFEVGIWSSEKEWYLNSALDCIMWGLRSKVLFAWDQTQCTHSGFNTLEKKEKPVFLKELKKVWDNKGLHKGQYSSSNTLLIDNNPYKALFNPPDTAIFPSEYKANQVDDIALGPKGDLRLYLDGLARAEDVPSHVKAHTYGQPVLSAKHLDWEYYSKIINHISKE